MRFGSIWSACVRVGTGSSTSSQDWSGSAADGANGRIVLLITPHSLRRPDGYCLNELARALARGLSIVPVMVVWAEPPLSICRIQWLDMRDCVPVQLREERYALKRDKLIEVLEQGRLAHDDAQGRLLRLLEPMPFDADLAHHVSRFVVFWSKAARDMTWVDKEWRLALRLRGLGAGLARPTFDSAKLAADLEALTQ